MSERTPEEIAMIVERCVVLISRERRERLNACKDVLREVINAHASIRACRVQCKVERGPGGGAESALDGSIKWFETVIEKASNVFFECHKL